MRVAISFPQGLLCFEVVHLLLIEGGKYAAVFQVALNAIACYAFTDNSSAFECHIPDQLRCRGARTTLDAVKVSAVAVDDLPAIAPRGAETDLGCFQYDYAETLFKKKQGRRQACVSGADHAHVGLLVFLESLSNTCRVGRRCVVGSGIIVVRHLGFSVLNFLRILALDPVARQRRNIASRNFQNFQISVS